MIFLILAAKLQKIIVILQQIYNINMEKKRVALRKLLEAVEKEILRKPDKKVLDRLSLFAGFQDWNSFQDALHGDVSADENYK